MFEVREHIVDLIVSPLQTDVLIYGFQLLGDSFSLVSQTELIRKVIYLLLCVLISQLLNWLCNEYSQYSGTCISPPPERLPKVAAMQRLDIMQ